MNSALALYGLVRVRQLTAISVARDGWHVNLRAPEIGDVGTLVDVLQTPHLPDHYLVECARHDGQTLWLSEFEADELEPVG